MNIIIGEAETLTIGMGLTLTSVFGDGDIENIATTALTTASTISLGHSDDQIVVVQDAKAYVESMTDEELLEFESRLARKEYELEDKIAVIPEEKPKTYTK